MLVALASTKELRATADVRKQRPGPCMRFKAAAVAGRSRKQRNTPVHGLTRPLVWEAPSCYNCHE